MVKSLLAMWAAGGGERAEDLNQFRQDKALALLLGHQLPAAQTARDFLTQFHAEDLPLLQEGQAPVAGETTPLLGLAKANTELVLDLQCRRPVKTATLDVDATVIHCDKRAAKRPYAAISRCAGAVGRTSCDRCRGVPRRQCSGRAGQPPGGREDFAALPGASAYPRNCPAPDLKGWVFCSSTPSEKSSATPVRPCCAVPKGSLKLSLAQPDPASPSTAPP